MPLDARIEKAFAYVSDLAKQLITLSTGIITITIAFSKDILGNTGSWPRGLLMPSWVLYILSIICGIWTLMALAGSLEPAGGVSALTPDPSTRKSNVVIPYVAQFISFILATVLIVSAGLVSVQNSAPSNKPQPPTQTPLKPQD